MKTKVVAEQNKSLEQYIFLNKKLHFKKKGQTGNSQASSFFNQACMVSKK